ncbi:hypothetical protein B0H13DRAFT_2005300 [Mycena leptocephala]|nr:hypothetical protein B0H13DRAFT_2005300 [Mycena leptocephala]
MTNCTSATFTWFYGADTDSQPGDLTFIITSDVPGDSDLDQIITPETVDPLARIYTWPSVNATPGGYQIAAQSLLAPFLVLSNSFKVVQGACRSTSVTSKSQTTTKSQQPDDLTLIITSDVPRVTALDELITPEPLDPLARSYTWSSVKAIPGVYQIAAKSNSAQWLILSGPFNVVNGTDTSCRFRSTSSVSASGAVTPASQTTSSGPAVTSGGSGPQNRPSPQIQSKVNTGAIAGGVVGGLAILIAILICVIRRRSRTRISTTPADVSPFLIPGQPGTSTVTQERGKTGLAWDAPGVGESQEGSGKRHRMGEMMHRDERDAREGGQSTQASAVNPSDSVSERSEQQLRAMAERLAAMEAHLRTQGHPEEQPPDYNAEPAPPRT